MSHTHDRTLLASLGFADPDKGDRRHTLACQYLSDPGRLIKVLEALHPGRLPGVPTLTPEEHDRAMGSAGPPSAASQSGPSRVCGLRIDAPGKCELPIHRKHGFLVGFWDVYATGARRVWTPHRRVVETEESVRRRQEVQRARMHGIGRWLELGGGLPMPEAEPMPEPVMVVERFADSGWRGLQFYIEVKIAPCDPATIARQIATYRGDRMYDPEGEVTIAAVTWAMHPEDKAMLKRNRIDVIRLGKPFEDWCEARKSTQGVPDVEF